MIEHKMLDEETCDLCQKKISFENSFDVLEASFEMVVGASFPEESFTTTFKADFCTPCARIVLNKLREIGCKPYKYDEDVDNVEFLTERDYNEDPEV